MAEHATIAGELYNTITTALTGMVAIYYVRHAREDIKKLYENFHSEWDKLIQNKRQFRAVVHLIVSTAAGCTIIAPILQQLAALTQGGSPH